MNDRTCQVWEENGVTFVVVGPSKFYEMLWYPVLVLITSPYSNAWQPGQLAYWPESIPWEEASRLTRLV